MAKQIATKHWLWRKWTNIRQSVNNPNCNDYNYAGARGAGVYWDNFWDFAEWVESNLGKPPKNKSRLCRIDTDGDYAPGNLFWGNQKIHNNRNHAARMLKYKGQEMSIMDWSRKTGISYWTLIQRIWRGMPPEQALKKTL